ncbi:hypothetical protein, partial [Vibrio parahaemolyticus]|uniref:hypothetical protein n=1 Tax=Vibrio parahaemolyticus TaxID=670 RepID=UPI001BAF0987
MSDTVLGQKGREQRSQTDRLPPLSQPVDCGLILRYIDEALEKADLYKSNIILIIKIKDTRNFSLARTRSNNLKNYLRFRGFKDFEVAVDLDPNEAEKVDLHVRGELLYSIPIKS